METENNNQINFLNITIQKKKKKDMNLTLIFRENQQQTPSSHMTHATHQNKSLLVSDTSLTDL
jgi:hypothetical protein